jgi:hypothetical protein
LSRTIRHFARRLGSVVHCGRFQRGGRILTFDGKVVRDSRNSRNIYRLFDNLRRGSRGDGSRRRGHRGRNRRLGQRGNCRAQAELRITERAADNRRARCCRLRRNRGFRLRLDRCGSGGRAAVGTGLAARGVGGVVEGFCAEDGAGFGVTGVTGVIGFTAPGASA